MEGSSSFVSKARTAFHSAAAKAERVFTDFKHDHHRPEDCDKNLDRPVKSQSELESPKREGDSKGNNQSKYLRWKPPSIVTKQEWQDRFKNIRLGKSSGENTEKAEDSTMAVPFFDENVFVISVRNESEAKGSAVSSAEGSTANNNGLIPSASIVKQLAVAVEAGKTLKSMKDFLASSRGSSPLRERSGLSFSAVKSLVLREKEDKSYELGDDDEVLSLMHSLLDAGRNILDELIFSEGQYPGRKVASGSSTPRQVNSLPKDIHGAPPETFVVKLAEVIGSFKTLKKMALFWCSVVAHLQRLWFEGQYVPGIPKDEIPDLNCCLLYQKLQVINCCISRKKRHVIATEALESVIREANSADELSNASKGMSPSNAILYARISIGKFVLRLGADQQFDNLLLLETGEPMCRPITQEGPLLTEDLIKETEEFILRTGRNWCFLYLDGFALSFDYVLFFGPSVGAGCSQLLSDMQAFKAANPGCILEDFVRWHSPPDWTETELRGESDDFFSGEGDPLGSRGQLSRRMQKEGNLWQELWETAKPVPAVKQAPLFDEDLAVEGILNFLEDISPSELFEQLFVSLVGLGFVLAEDHLSTNDSLSKLFSECKDYIVATCQGHSWSEKVDDICQGMVMHLNLNNAVETMLLNPEEVLKNMKQQEETPNSGEPKRRFKRLSFIFGGKDRITRKQTPKDQNNSSSIDDNATPGSKSLSIFSKKPPKPESYSEVDRPVGPEENDWTII
ncbi:Rab3GAP catalytic subunit, conserved domain [Dillenia turbinata]|uniref:Rab3GAP catalytic subunit, conserved domain n=1 Tax=Dillenia turbinata TaxID=194707 RepID=A0AAN8VQZ9_9MAGN